ncbi:membrane integrity-associated transporter subunit PqiC [Aquincola sp. S2]|uniref:Membrane integrity-associated transporter subunit PqiC n=1 Tax=Pseudaquabacterium terrae TaxID=2732868 RepID=A0ABX2EHT1_9BURK|nr:PqiC family protein [Aquabacterium terrae]NRF68139.1 membrane integrity-associated transporter subunit PqiC [Aquabacterium terrae]
MKPPTPLLLAATVGLALCGCTSRPAAPNVMYRLPVSAPVDVGPVSVPSGWTWQLMGPVHLPDYLDRDAVLLPQGSAGLRPLTGHRWAEPLHEAVPRLLRHDLASLLGADRVWSNPLPPGIVITRQVRVELLAFEATPDRRTVRLRARWTIVDPRGQQAPKVEQADISVASAGPEAEQLVDAHRLALWRLAERVAGVPAS